MGYIFDYLEIIEDSLKHAPFGLIIDLDDVVLSDNIPTIEEIQIPPAFRRYLTKLCRSLALVTIISGRSVAELNNLIGIKELVYVGNHGLERWRAGQSKFPEGTQDYSTSIKAAVEELSLLLHTGGINIQTKGMTALIHYNLALDLQSAVRNIFTALQDSPHARDLRVVQKKTAIELLPPVKVNKGTATLELIQEYGLRGGIYMGGDPTDIPAFRVIHAAKQGLDFHGFALGITSHGMLPRLLTEVDFTLHGLGDVERFLQWLSKIATNKALV